MSTEKEKSIPQSNVGIDHRVMFQLLINFCLSRIVRIMYGFLPICFIEILCFAALSISSDDT